MNCFKAVGMAPWFASDSETEQTSGLANGAGQRS